MRVLFLGDIVGRTARNEVIEQMPVPQRVGARFHRGEL